MPHPGFGWQQFEGLEDHSIHLIRVVSLLLLPLFLYNVRAGRVIRNLGPQHEEIAGMRIQEPHNAGRRLRCSIRRYGFPAILPIAYVLIAWGHWGILRSEFYPFAPWSMFNNVPNSVTRYVLFVQQADNPESTDAVPLWELIPGGVKALPLPVYRAQARLGLAIEAQQFEPAIQAQKQIRRFLRSKLSGGTAVLMKEVFVPTEMYLNGTLRENRKLYVLSF